MEILAIRRGASYSATLRNDFFIVVAASAMLRWKREDFAGHPLNQKKVRCLAGAERNAVKHRQHLHPLSPPSPLITAEDSRTIGLVCRSSALLV
jgi:hypothetical protein